MKIIRFSLILVLMCYVFFVNSDPLVALTNDLQSLTGTFESLNTGLNKLVQLEPKNIKLPSAEKMQSAFSVQQTEKKNINVLDEITEQSKKQLKLVWDSFDWDEFKKNFKKEYESQIVGTKASVQKGVRLTQKGTIDPMTFEGKFLARRTDDALKSLQQFTGLKFNDKGEMPRIGCCFSGGGYRAMILTSGYLEALEQLGLLDSVLYIAALSGSTWYLGPWTLQQDPSAQKKITVEAFNQLLIDKIQKQHFDLLSTKHIKDFDPKLFASDIIWPKVLFDQVISSVDVFGAALAHVLLTDAGKNRQLQRLSDQLKSVELGNHPWPIYTSVSMHKSDDPKTPYRYNWYEFNPSEVRNLENNIYIPSYSFGRKFESAQSTDFPPEQSFGFLMGIFGSAYTVNLQDLIRIFFGGSAKTDAQQEALLTDWYKKPAAWSKAAISKIKDIFVMASKAEFKQIWELAKSDLDQIKGAVLVRFLGFVTDVTIKLADRTITVGGKEIKVRSARFAPAQIFNPFKGYSGIAKWLQDRELLTFVDAGIDYNIPLRPLLRPERDLDVIIIGDASGNVPEGTGELDLALADIKRFYGLSYKKDEQLSAKNMMIYRPDQINYPSVEQSLKGIRPPVLIYFNFLKDENLLNTMAKSLEMKLLIDENKLMDFDAGKCLADEYCGTFNFNYSVEAYKQLSKLGKFNILAREAILKAIIEERAELRIEYPEFGG